MSNYDSAQDWPNWLPLRDDLKEQSPYGAPQLPLEVKLNTNENPFSLSPALVKKLSEAIANSAKDFNRYPDRDAIELRSELAKYLSSTTGVNLSVDQIWAANGSNEILQSIFLAFGEKAMGFLPSYSMHPLIAKTAKCEWVAGSREPNFSLDIVKASLAIADAKSSECGFFIERNELAIPSPTTGEPRIENLATRQRIGLITQNELNANAAGSRRYVRSDAALPIDNVFWN